MHHRHPGKSDSQENEKVPAQQSLEAEPSAAVQRRVDEIIQKQERLNAWQRVWKRLAVVKYIFLILILPPILNYAALQRERAVLLPAQGDLIDIGWGQKIFMKCIGEGLPTVILDAPTGGTSDLWYLIQAKLSKYTKVCVYDRAGLGFSELPFTLVQDVEKGEKRKFVSQMATLEQMSSDLHHIITVGKSLRPPLVLVGSEIGALIARHYALTHPEDVLEIVLLNPLVEDLFWRQKEEWNVFWHQQMLPSLESLQLSAYIGISRLAIFAGHMKADVAGSTVPKEVELTQLSHLCNGNHVGAVMNEYRLLNTSFSQMNELWTAKDFPKNISVTVITSRNYNKFPLNLMQAWQQSQLYLRQSLHPSCKHYLVDGSGQQLFIQPKTVVNIVQQIVHQWRVTYDVLGEHVFKGQESYAE